MLTPLRPQSSRHRAKTSPPPKNPLRPRAILIPQSKTNDKGQVTNDQQLTTDHRPLTTRAFPPPSSLIIHRSAFSFPLPRVPRGSLSSRTSISSCANPP